MRAFVTGGSGFVGRALIAALRAEGHEVRALARSEAAAEAVRRAGAEAVAGDLDDASKLQAGLSGCEAAFHAAAAVTDWGRYDDFHRVNVAGTERVIEAARAAGVKRLVHVGTEAVLAGGGPIRNTDETRPPPAFPVGLYPATKALAEARAVAANGIGGLETVVVRPRFIWGKDDTSLLPKFVEAARAGKFAWIDGGRYLTSTCHVRNLCEGMLLAAARGKAGEIYFLTDGPPVELRGFLTAMLKTQGVDLGERSIPYAVAYAAAWAAEAAWSLLDLGGAPPITRTTILLMGEEVTVSDAKARRDLGYVGKVSREAGLAEMAAEAAAPAPAMA